MSECPYCQNTFEMTESCSDEFRMWQGLVGPYYIPSVDENGVISWTNTGGLPNPDPEDISGPPGKGLTIKGVVATVGDLPEDPEDGDTYLVGASDPYDGYIWLNGTWVELGDISKGETGEGVPTGGTTGQVLAKASSADYDTEWKTPDPGVDPATAAPLMDGTAAVGSSTKYAREDHVHPVYDQMVRPNLLDNWYFVGGGSQQGGGQFPINQRGQATYSSSGFCLDRWQTEGSVTISSGYVATGSVLFQGCETGLMDALLGKTVTLSCLKADGTLVSGQITLPGSYPGSVTKYQAATGLYIALYSGGAGQIFRIEGSQNVVAVKLELGTTQTLAHQEYGTWVLNEIPNYGEELAKCQRYFMRLTNGSWGSYALALATSETVADAIFNLPVTLRGWPTATFNGNIRVGDNAISAVNQYPNRNENGICVSITSSGLTPGNCYLLRNYNDSSAYIDISCDL